MYTPVMQNLPNVPPVPPYLGTLGCTPLTATLHVTLTPPTPPHTVPDHVKLDISQRSLDLLTEDPLDNFRNNSTTSSQNYLKFGYEIEQYIQKRY